MNELYFPTHLKLIHLTPFKVSLCYLISNFLKDENINCEYHMFDLIRFMINDYKSEISRSHFDKNLKEFIDKKENIKKLNYTDNIYNYIISSLEVSYSELKSLNDLYTFFNLEIKELKTRNEDEQSILENGGFIDSFIRKCLFAFYKMSFEDISKLYENLNKYINGEELFVQLTNRESELLFEKQMGDFDKKGTEKSENQYLNSFAFKHKYFYFSKINGNSDEALNDIHKFFDYNMKYFYSDGYTSDTKIHYSMLNLIEYYFENKYYRHAIQVIFECIKLNQSNCDHEGLLKCFIWLQKIYKVLGKFEMAAKSLSTCLIKSFENNFNFLYLISSSELAFLNYYYHSEIGESIIDKTSSLSFEEKVLAYSNSNTHAYKNILQLLSSSKTDVYERNPQYFFKNVFIVLILNLLRKGESSLAVSFLKKLVDYLFKDPIRLEYDFSSDNPNSTLETLKIILNLFHETMEYDLEYSIEWIWKIILVNKNLKVENLVEKMKLKLLSYGGRLHYTTDKPKFDDISYNYAYNTFLYFQNFILKNSLQDLPDLESELVTFRNYCKINRFQKLKLQTDILITKIYLSYGKVTESLFNVNKIIEKAKDEQTILKAKILLAEIYSKVKDKNKTQEIINQIEPNVQKYSNVVDRFQFYHIKTQLIIAEYIKDSENKSLRDSLYKQLRNLIKSSLLTNNEVFIKTSNFLMSYIFPNEITNNLVKIHLENLKNLFQVFSKIKLSQNEQLELIRVILIITKNFIKLNFN